MGHSRLQTDELCRTLPPFFMPIAEVDRAGGGLGPLCAEKLPPATPPSAFLALRSNTGLPTVKVKGCTAHTLSEAARCFQGVTKTAQPADC